MEAMRNHAREHAPIMDFTIRAVNGYVDRVMESGFDGVVINVTNPCDVVAWRFAELSGLPRGRVFSTSDAPGAAAPQNRNIRSNYEIGRASCRERV